jgi:uroporphyrinogen decarboxylase
MSSARFTPLQRFAAYGRGEAIDRLPCVPIIGNTAARLIVASGCSLPTETPFGNIQAMMDAVTEIGWPINPDKLKAN